jgi:glycerophosphoryl diester phosphodiesterase
MAFVLAGISCAFGTAEAQARAAVDVSAHRGDRSYLRENTMSAFYSALESQASSIEFDVHLTKDLVPVIYHDYALNPRDFRGLDKPVLIKDLALAEVQAFLFRPDKPTLNGDFRVPTLERFLHSLKLREKYDLRRVDLHLEIKSEAGHLHEAFPPETLVRRIFAVIDESGVRDRIIVRSFNWDVIGIAKHLRPNTERILLVDEGLLAGIDVAAAVEKYEPLQVAPYFKDVTGEIVQAWRSHGVTLAPYTVNDPSEALRLLELGVTGFATDHPQKLAAVLNKNHYKIGSPSGMCESLFTGR